MKHHLGRRERRLVAEGRCPDCGAGGVSRANRCGQMPRKGMVFGHGPGPTKAPPKAHR